MSQEPICPEVILRLFENKSTISEGRLKAIQWAQREIVNVEIGGAIWMPDPKTGYLKRFVKSGTVLS